LDRDTLPARSFGYILRSLERPVLVFVGDSDGALAISFLILLGAVFLLGQIIAYVLKRTASLLMLGWADRLGGAAFGLLKGLIIVEILLILFAAYPQLGLDDAIAGSELAPLFLDDAPVLLRVLPGRFDDRVDQFLAPETG